MVTQAPALECSSRAAVLARRIRLLVATTIGYNVVEALVALVAGGRASSTALVGFGLDSAIEVASTAAVAWQFCARDPAVRQAREHRSLRVVAWSFFALSACLAVESTRALTGGARAAESSIGLALAVASLLVMPVLSTAQRRTGRELGSASAVADSRQTLLCTGLSAVLLAGLGVNAVFGWGWADPAAGLVIAALALREGRSAWRGESCCAPAVPPGVATGPGRDSCPDGCCPSDT